MITKGGGVDALTSGGHPRCPTQLIAPGLRSDDWSVTRCLGSLPAQSPRPRSSAPLLSISASLQPPALSPPIYLSASPRESKSAARPHIRGFSSCSQLPLSHLPSPSSPSLVRFPDQYPATWPTASNSAASQFPRLSSLSLLSNEYF